MNEPYDVDAENEQPSVGQLNRFLPRFVATLVSPKALFDEIEQGAHWWQPWVWVSLINIVSAQLFKPIYLHLMELNPNDLPQDQLDQTIEMTNKLWFIGILSTPVQMLMLTALIAAACCRSPSTTASR